MKEAGKVSQNLLDIQSAIDQACRHKGLNPQHVQLLAVTKYACDKDVLALLKTGQVHHIGESRIQQAVARWTNPSFAKYNVYKHFIGHLQKNKVVQAARLFDFIDSIDNFSTAQALDIQAQKLGKILYAMVQIKLTDKQTQSGICLSQAPVLLEKIRTLDNLVPCGYMAIAPQTQDEELLRSLFKQVKMAFDRDFPPHLKTRFLSLGMSNDFEIAVEEGSTLPRVGNKLFAAKMEEV